MNTMDIKPIYDKVKPIFETMKGEENVEVELRFGKHNGSLFDTNMGKETWERVLRRLKKYQGWERVQSSVADVYYNDANNIRITVDEDSGEQTMIQKINVVKDDFKCTPNDIRFSISREIPTFGEYEMDRKRNKTRHSFVRKNLSIDMTISTGDSVDMDSEESCSYQIEMEIVNPQDVKSDDELYNIIHKISDLVKDFLS
jgi:acetolactate synthase regulatory subunit